jgi:arabinoxylan arabinofuranohydrolase
MKSVFFSTILAIAGAFVSADAFDDVEPLVSHKPITDHNPINVMKYTADPGVMVYDDTVYVYGTNDGILESMPENPEANEYSLIHSINVMSSKDLVNWVDHGTIPVGQDIAKWAQNSWAPTAAHKKINGKEKFFLYFANSGNGIGVVSADSPTGPFVDPIGDYLISHNTTNCETITWLFDPAVFVDDDGTGYIYFGGGVPGEYENAYDNYEKLKDNPQFERPRTLRAAKLGDDMISLASEPVLIDAPWPYEDSGIHKVDGIYYYTYCTNWNEKSPFGQARIGMMASKSPLGPFEFVDTIFNNPGDFFTIYGNNHHTVIPFHDKFYIFYHSEWLNYHIYGEARGYRTTHVNELPYVDGKFLNATGTLEGVNQLFAVDPYQPQPAALMAWEAGTSTNGLGHTTITYQKGEWTGVSGVDFFDGANTIELVAQSAKGATVKITVDSPEGDVLGYVNIPASNKMETVYVEIAQVEGVKNIFFIASDEVTIDTWEFGSTDDCSEEEVEETVCTSDDEDLEALEDDVDSENDDDLDNDEDSCEDEE